MKKIDDFTKNQKWFLDAKFGIFIHFGLYTLLGGNENDYKKGIMKKEDYENMMYRFNPKKFNAEKWVKLIKESGAKYLVITTKHGEGFCLWDTKTTDYKITNTPFKRDIIKELSSACRSSKLYFGVYYSLVDRHYGEKGGILEYQSYVKNQLEELLTKYGEIDCVWFDGGDKRLTEKFMQKLISYIHKIQPRAVVNNRGVDFHEPGPKYGDYVTPERYIPDFVRIPHPFIECCDAMGQKSWGYCKNEKFWSGPELVKRLTMVASLGGNYLLNVEPTPEGEIRKECVERLKIIEDWLKLNKDAVYGTKECFLYPVDNSLTYLPKIGCATRKRNKIYIFLHQWPTGDSVLIPNLSGEVKTVRIIGMKKKMEFKNTPKGLSLSELPSMPLNGLISVIKISFVQSPNIKLNKIFSERRKVINVIPNETVYLRANMGERVSRNNVPRHCINKWSENLISIGCWWRFKTEVIWHLKVEKGGNYKIFVDQGANELQKDAIFEIEISSQKIKGKISFTGGYDKPARIEVGKIKIPSGYHKLKLRVLEMPNGYFADIYNIILQPIFRRKK